MHGYQYMTNQFDARIPIHGLLTNLRKMLFAKIFNSSHDEDHKAHWLQNPTVYKHNNFFKKKDELGQILSPVTICMNTTLLHTRATFDGP